MAVDIKYIGTQVRWPELAVTGKQSVWYPGQEEERSDAEAAALLATGLFSRADSGLTSAQVAGITTSVVGADGSVLVSGGVLSPYTGVVATRCRIPTTLATNVKYAMTRSRHVAVDKISAAGIVVGGWYANNGGETNTGVTITYKGSIEYAGVITPLTWGSAASADVASGATQASDLVTLPTAIPPGAFFYVRIYGVSSATSMPLSNLAGLNPIASAVNDSGEAFSFSIGTPNDLTAGGAVTNSSANFMLYPMAIIGRTSRKTWLIAMDSRGANGATITEAVTGPGALLGYAERNISESCATINASVAGILLSASFTKRLTLAQYCSHVLTNLAGNDIVAGNTLAQVKASQVTWLANFTGKPVYWMTMEPISTSTDQWTTIINQTTAASNAVRITWNAYLRTGALNVAGVVDVADYLESSRDSGLWAVPPVVTQGTFTASITSATMTVSAAGAVPIRPGQLITGAGVTAGTYVMAYNTGTGGTGTYTLNGSQSVASTTLINTLNYVLDGTHASTAGAQLLTGNAEFKKITG